MRYFWSVRQIWQSPKRSQARRVRECRSYTEYTYDLIAASVRFCSAILSSVCTVSGEGVRGRTLMIMSLTFS